MTNDITFIPHVIINPSSIVSYMEVISNKPRKKSHLSFIDPDYDPKANSAFLNSTRKASGYISDQAKRKMSKAIEYLLATSQPKKVREKLSGKYLTVKTSFLTLTLPSKQIHDDKEIINICLNSMLNELRMWHNIKNYIWRAELQKNGNIHFHILTDRFIPWYDARNRWNRIVNKLGYVDRFHEKHGHRTPNSTDIHSTRRVKNLKAYLVKYMVKDEPPPLNEITPEMMERTQTGRTWSCNHELSQTRGLNLIIDNEIDTELKKVISHQDVKKYESDYFTVYYLDYHIIKKTGANLLFKYFSDYLYEKLHFSEQLTFTS